MDERELPTHIAYAIKREGRAEIRWLEIGVARIASDRAATHDIFIDRLPTGGFTGHIRLSPIGVNPALPESHPVRPTRATSEDGV